MQLEIAKIKISLLIVIFFLLLQIIKNSLFSISLFIKTIYK